jgi:hypothetical protein
METEAMGRLPKDVAEAGFAHELRPEYVAEAGKPSDEVWAHEEALYRGKGAGE